jgi:HEAT repeat protein
MLLRMMRAFAFVAIAAFAFLATATLTPNPAPVMAQDSLTNVKEALSDYKKGNYEEAIRKLDEALAADPDDETARRIRDEIGSELARDMVNNNFADAGLKGRYARFGKWVMAGLAKNPYIGRNNDPEQVAEFVDAYMGDADVARNELRAASIRDSFGDFAVPYIQQNYMHSDNADYRYRARLLLSRLGAQAVNALIQIFYSTEIYDRQVAALALADIGDARALPILAKHYQDKNEDEQVREACRLGIEEIRRLNPEQDKKVNNAFDLFFLQAEGVYRNNAAGRYYRNRLVGSSYQGHLPVVMYGYDRSYTVWKWIDANAEMKLVPQEVPLWAYADIVAEESALQAFELGVAQAGGSANTDGRVRDAEALLACIHMHMHSEARGRYYNGSKEERDFVTQMLGEHGYIPHFQAWGMAIGAGGPVLCAALERSLSDGYAAVSVDLCDAIAELGDTSIIGKPPGAALVRALADPDRTIRYAAARTLITLGADISFGNNALVEQVAVRNLQETQARAVLVIIEDEALRNRYLSDLESLGHSATGARTLEEGADLATQGPPWDAIIIEGDLAVAPVFVFELPALAGGADRPERSEPIFHLLKKDVRTSEIPVLIASLETEVDSRKDDLGGLGVAEDRFVTFSAEYQVDTEALGARLEDVWSGNIENSKTKTNGMVVAMADAIGDLNPATTKYSVEKLLVGLAGGLRLDGRSSAAREAICRAIEELVATGTKVGAAWVRQNILPNLIDTVNSTEAVDRPSVKAAAARAMGACYDAHAGAWDEDGFNALLAQVRLEYPLSEIADADQRAAMVEEVADARNAAGEAIGRAPTTAAQRSQFQRAQQTNPHTPHPDARTAGD